MYVKEGTDFISEFQRLATPQLSADNVQSSAQKTYMYHERSMMNSRIEFRDRTQG